MAVKKTYMLRFYQRMMKHVMINNKRVLVEFVSTSSFNPNIKGTFTTANPDIIKALEASPDFNREYAIKSVEEINETVKETIQYRANPLEVKKFREELEKDEFLSEGELATKLADKKVSKVSKEPETPEPVEVKIEDEKVVVESKDELVVIPISEVPNFQQAKNYLKAKFPELTVKQILNKASVLAVAVEKGIKFEALQS